MNTHLLQAERTPRAWTKRQKDEHDWMVLSYLPMEEHETAAAASQDGFVAARMAIMPSGCLYNWLGEPKPEWLKDTLGIHAYDGAPTPHWDPQLADKLTLRYLIQRHDFSHNYSDSSAADQAGEASEKRIVAIVRLHPEWLPLAITTWNDAARKEFSDGTFDITPGNVIYVFRMPWPEELSQPEVTA